MVQISTKLIYSDQNNSLMDNYYEKLYKIKEKDGYYKGEDYWEIPKWQSLINYNIKSDNYICKDINETINFIKNSNYEYICFSVLEVNKDIIRNIINSINNKLFIIGGYINFNKFIKSLNYSNFKYFETIEKFINFLYNKKEINCKYKYGFNNNLFDNFKTIPRLTLSNGCFNRCTYCTVENNLKEIPEKDIFNEVKSFKNLNFKLIYIDDKTFSQCQNYILLPKIYNKIKSYNKKFEGFIIQTTPNSLIKIPYDFLKKSHIKFIELGLETINDNILKEYKKPFKEKNILKSFDYIRKYNKFNEKILLIANLIIGFKEETKYSYDNTIRIIKGNLDIISHFNIYNFSIYENTEISKKINYKKEDQNELIIEKSFHKNKRIHSNFHNEILNLAILNL